ncbi:hypothetical protein QBC38DRAFT_187642 [Podospora fimiseda]|uniref:Uncharacterized protein n=1 Tax=Podospora fimiseda TaxID=252190 RepID=A0AAN7BQG9_9PEZI|nr:hypothetical protein QBC38DRAFT_187642 [Podospora fimiseda]
MRLYYLSRQQTPRRFLSRDFLRAVKQRDQINLLGHQTKNTTSLLISPIATISIEPCYDNQDALLARIKNLEHQLSLKKQWLEGWSSSRSMPNDGSRSFGNRFHQPTQSSSRPHNCGSFLATALTTTPAIPTTSAGSMAVASIPKIVYFLAYTAILAAPVVRTRPFFLPYPQLRQCLPNKIRPVPLNNRHHFNHHTFVQLALRP